MHCSFFPTDIRAHKIFYFPLRNLLPKHLFLPSSIFVVWTALPPHFTILLLCTATLHCYFLSLFLLFHCGATHCVATSFQYLLKLKRMGWIFCNIIAPYIINGTGEHFCLHHVQRKNQKIHLLGKKEKKVVFFSETMECALKRQVNLTENQVLHHNSELYRKSGTYIH